MFFIKSFGITSRRQQIATATKPRETGMKIQYGFASASVFSSSAVSESLFGRLKLLASVVSSFLASSIFSHL